LIEVSAFPLYRRRQRQRRLRVRSGALQPQRQPHRLVYYGKELPQQGIPFLLQKVHALVGELYLLPAVKQLTPGGIYVLH